MSDKSGKMDCLGVVCALDTIQFNYKSAENNKGEVVDAAEGDHRIQFGFSAQQLSNYYPVDRFAVVNRSPEGFLNVNYPMLVPVLSKAIKILRGMFTSMDEKLSKLEQRWESTDEEMAERNAKLEERVKLMEDIIYERVAPDLHVKQPKG